MTDTATVPATEKPVYSTGASLGEIMKGNEAAASQPAPAAESSQSAQPAQPAADPASNPTATTEPVVSPEQQEPNVANFSLAEYETPVTNPISQPEPKQEAVATDWRAVIKTADQTELLKEVGVSDFAIELDRYMKSGGDPVDYLNAKAVDYNKITDDSIVKADLQKQYPTFSPSQIDLMFSRKYGVDESAEPEDREFAELQLKADAHNIRQKKIAEQQQFKIPAASQPSAASEQQSEQQAAEYRRQMEETLKWWDEHEATKSLISSKRVAIDLGENGKFNYAVDKPELLMKGILDSETWRRMTSTNPKESDVSKLIPDVAKMQRLVLAATNPNYEKDLVNYGRSLALKTLVEEGQNLSAPPKVIPMGGANVSEKDLWRTAAKSSTVGG